MDGTLTIIDGAPGRGKSLLAVQLMLDSVYRHHKIATNIAILPAFVQQAKRIWSGAEVVLLDDDAGETRHFWELIPPGYDVYVDEAHLIWSARDWKINSAEKDSSGHRNTFQAYISQFRKDGDSLWLLCQNFANLDIFIRQRATRFTACRRVGFPEFVPRVGGRPIFFFQRTYNVENGQRQQAIGLPRVVTAAEMLPYYKLYDTRAKVAANKANRPGSVVSRPTGNKVMPIVLSDQPEPGQSSQTYHIPIPPANPAYAGQVQPQQTIVQVNANHHAEKPRRKWKRYVLAVLALFLVADAIYDHQHLPAKKNHKQIIVRKVYKKSSKLRLYGIIGDSVILGNGSHVGLLPIGLKFDGWKILDVNYGGIQIMGPAGKVTQRYWWWPPKPKAPDTLRHQAGAMTIHEKAIR